MMNAECPTSNVQSPMSVVHMKRLAKQDLKADVGLWTLDFIFESSPRRW